MDLHRMLARRQPPIARPIDSDDEDEREASGGEDDGLDFETPKQLMTPVILDGTQRRLERDTADEAACAGRPCMLCDIGIDDTVEGVADAILEIFADEHKLRNTMDNDVLYEGLTKQFNARIVAQARIVGKDIEPLTFTMTRRHFTQNHGKSLERDLEHQAAVTRENLLELERGALWLQGADDEPKQPDTKNMMLHMKLQEAFAKRVYEIIRLRQSCGTGTGTGGGGVRKKGGGRTYPFRKYDAEQ